MKYKTINKLIKQKQKIIKRLMTDVKNPYLDECKRATKRFQGNDENNRN